jgi:hypothetical protein
LIWWLCILLSYSSPCLNLTDKSSPPLSFRLNAPHIASHANTGVLKLSFFTSRLLSRRELFPDVEVSFRILDLVQPLACLRLTQLSLQSAHPKADSQPLKLPCIWPAPHDSRKCSILQSPVTSDIQFNVSDLVCIFESTC